MAMLPVAGTFFMSWLNKINRIVVLNLPHREDRLLHFAAQADKYELPYHRIEAIKDNQGAKGLKDTMVKLFTEEIEKGTKHILVFEDDAEILLPPPIFHDTMDKVTEQLPENYWMCFLGCQITGSISHFPSPNIIQASKMFSTHSVLYSLQGMKEIMARGMDSPIDNFYVDKVEGAGNSYCTYPLLCSQKPDVSDIGGQFIDWTPFIQARFQTRIAEYHGR
jgi:hypothetical protein